MFWSSVQIKYYYTMLKYNVALLLLLAVSSVNGQIVFSNGASVSITPGAIVHCNGGVKITNSSNLTNNGTLIVTKNSSISLAGNFENSSASVVSGNGTYAIEQDWINSATFQAQTSEVILNGNTEQLITSTNGTITEFNDLTLTGNGTGTNQRKSLFNVDGRTSVNGILNLNDRELYTGTQSFEVLNVVPNAILQSTTFGLEGFVSSLNPGYLVRHTNQVTSYLFPVGSSDGVYRYRPIELTPTSSSAAAFNVRLNNYSADLDGFLLSQSAPNIDAANSLFYHSIDRSSGASNVAIRTHYLAADDGDWTSTAHWYPANIQWEDVANTTNGISGNFAYNEKANWNFPTANKSYVLINTSSELIIPNVFTPNEDGTNDEFFILSKGLTDYNLVIVNRWGNPVFETTDPAAVWDGTSGGDPCNEGTYFYILKAKSSGKDIVMQGHITLHRN